jgi:hypothetical protein
VAVAGSAMASLDHDVGPLSERTLSSPCSICFESLRVDRYTAMTECCHYFHVTCLSEWLRRVPSCPVCRQSCGPCCIEALHATSRLIASMARREQRLSLFSRMRDYIRIKWWSWRERASTRALHYILPVTLVRLGHPCMLCSGVMLHDEFTVATHCGHYFHAKCIRDWFTRSFKCPKCPYVFALCCVDSLRQLCRSLP